MAPFHKQNSFDHFRGPRKLIFGLLSDSVCDPKGKQHPTLSASDRNVQTKNLQEKAPSLSIFSLLTAYRIRYTSVKNMSKKNLMHFFGGKNGNPGAGEMA